MITSNHTSQGAKELYNERTKLSDLICTNYALLMIITRYGIPLGVGDDSIGEVCRKHQLDVDTLLLLLNSTASNTPPSSKQLEKLSLEDLLRYLSNSHHYFLDFRLPKIRQQLLAAIVDCTPAVATAIRNFFDEYVDEVHKHMAYEDKTVFPYARKLLSGESVEGYRISIFAKRHDQIELKITELKNLIIKYYPAASGYELVSVLHDIFSSEEDLAAHNYIEDHVFVPYIEQLEEEHTKR